MSTILFIHKQNRKNANMTKKQISQKKIIESELGRHNICKFSRDRILVTTFQ